MDIQTRDEFKKLIYGFFRDKKLDSREMSGLLRGAFEFFSTEHAKESKSWLDMRKKLSQQSIDDFKEMWEGFVQQSIDYVADHEDVRQLIEAERSELTEEWNRDIEDGENRIIPDLRLYFGVDGLDESVEEGSWVSATDASISLQVGNRNIIEMM